MYTKFIYLSNGLPLIIVCQNRCTITSSGSLNWIRESTQQRRTVKKVYRLDGSMAYGAAGQLFDIAILEVGTPFTLNEYVVPAKLPTARTPTGTNLTVSGWGDTTEGIFSYLLEYNSINNLEVFI
jgi:hypothetical protein